MDQKSGTIENRQLLKEKLQVFISFLILSGEMKIVIMFYNSSLF